MTNICAFKVSKLYPSLENHPGLGSLCAQATEPNNNIVGRVGKKAANAGQGTGNCLLALGVQPNRGVFLNVRVNVN